MHGIVLCLKRGSNRHSMQTHGNANIWSCFNHDNARLHTAIATAETIRKLKFELLSHPAYSPDLAPYDYRTLRPLKDVLRGR